VKPAGLNLSTTRRGADKKISGCGKNVHVPVCYELDYTLPEIQ
jgi:hypothetical protein